jgi:hypothetical protein
MLFVEPEAAGNLKRPYRRRCAEGGATIALAGVAAA